MPGITAVPDASARGVFERIFNMSWQKMGMSLIYDLAHNIAKIEKYVVDGKEKTLCVHRKGQPALLGRSIRHCPSATKRPASP